MFNEDQSDNICTFLSRLTTTAEFKNAETKQFLAKRIVSLFQTMSSNQSIKEIACNVIREGITSCADRIIAAVDDIESMIEIDEIEKKNLSEKELREQAKRFLYLDMVNEEAERHVKSLPYVDEVEVYLALKINLSKRFNLPINTQNMIFIGRAHITDAQIKEAGNRIEKECTKEKLDEYLKEWGPWLKSQRNKNANIKYENLEEYVSNQLNTDTLCPITQEYPQQPVDYKGIIYDYEPFMDQYKKNGKNPMNHEEKIDIGDLKKAIKGKGL